MATAGSALRPSSSAAPMYIPSLPRACAGAARAAKVQSRAMRDRGCVKGKTGARQVMPGPGQCRNGAGRRQPENERSSKIPRSGDGAKRSRPILPRVRIVLPRLSPQGAREARHLPSPIRLRRPGLSTRAAFHLAGAGRRAAQGLAICGGARLDVVASRFENQLKGLPAKPGVYLFRDKAGEVLYVGKAKSLRPRVRSYFQQSQDTRSAIQQLPERVEDIEVIVTQNEVEALHLEQNLVKRHRPPFNVRLRDDKSFPYIAVTVADEYPRVMFTRERHRRGVVYFGPYANAKKVRETLDVLNRVFPYRPCEGPKPGRHSGIPCLDYHIDRCLAPCVGYVSKEDYRAIIDQVIEFLEGNTRPIQRDLERRMKEAAADERFEDAARYRNRLFAIQGLAERQAVERQSVGTVDVIGVAQEGDRAVVQIFPLRGGKMVDRHSFHLENVGGQDLTTILEAFGLEYYGSSPSVPPQIIVPRDAGDLSALAELLSERRGARVEVRVAERGEKRRLQRLADENALHVLTSDLAAGEQRRLRRVEALEQLRETLNLESLPIRIECFDISTAMGQDNVGSLVVFQDGLPKKAHYRKFGIRGQQGMDDFAAMGEMISRRFA